jgi:hypothetical protein
MLEIREHASPLYPPRTYHNAKVADFTVAFAVDFSSKGEQLTHKAAGDRYLAVSLAGDPRDAGRMLCEALQRHGAAVLNVAGNSIATLSKHGWTQQEVNAYVLEVVAAAHEHWPLKQIVSGGQTGADIAGIVAARYLDIPAIATLPKGFIQRGVNGRDAPHTKEEVLAQVEAAVAALKVVNAVEQLVDSGGLEP